MINQESYNLLVQLTKEQLVKRKSIKSPIVLTRYDFGDFFYDSLFFFMTVIFFVNRSRNHTITSNNNNINEVQSTKSLHFNKY